jgi:hypothetical protein
VTAGVSNCGSSERGIVQKLTTPNSVSSTKTTAVKDAFSIASFGIVMVRMQEGLKVRKGEEQPVAFALPGGT